MKSFDASYFSIGLDLTLRFVLLSALILAGNGLIVWQFHLAHLEANRLTGANQELVAVLRLQESLLSFRQRLDSLAETRDTDRLKAEIDPLRRGLSDHIQQTRDVLTKLPPGTSVDPALLPTIEAIETTLPSQLKSITELADSGDWGAVQLRLANELRPMEAQTSALVESIDRKVISELKQSAVNMSGIDRTILMIVPVTAISTFLLAGFSGWSLARRILELRFDERAGERLRISRELHDTLFQTLRGAKLVADNALASPSDPAQVSHAVEQLSVCLDRASYECQAALNSLRASTQEKNDLAEAFRRSIRDFQKRTSMDLHFTVTGTFREMHPIVRDEIYQIGCEGIRNACTHSHANRVEVSLRYARGLTLRIIDNGIGIDPLLQNRGKDGHFGLQRMREQAARIGATFKIVSSANSGTDIRLIVPGRIAFRSRANPESKE
jgi:signal transduction histidine kinase